MCDGINDPGGPRRCPSQRGDRRRAYRRALYAAQKARAIRDPQGPAANTPDSGKAREPLPSVHDVHAAIAGADTAWRAFAETGDTASQDAYESAVRQVGALVAEQADHEISLKLGDGAAEQSAVAAEQETIDAEIKSVAAESDDLKKWRHEAIAVLRNRRPSRQEALEMQEKETEWVSKLNKRVDAVNAHNRDLDEMKRRRGIQEGRVIAAVLARYRDYGTSSASIHDNSPARAHRMLAEASTVYPADWVAASNDGIDMIVKESKKRAHYRGISRQTVKWAGEYDPPARLVTGQTWRTRKEMTPPPSTPANDAVREAAGIALPPSKAQWVAARDPETQRWQWKLQARSTSTRLLSEMRIPTKDRGAGFSHATTIHEFGHRCEAHNPKLAAACLAFRDRRTTDTDGRLHPLRQYAKGEHVRPDEFVNAYIGKDYRSTVHTEVLSMGMESVFGGSQGALRGYHGERADPEHRHLVLGLCASA